MEKFYRGAIKIESDKRSDSVHFIAAGESVQQVCGMALSYYKALNPDAKLEITGVFLAKRIKEVRIDFSDVKEVFYEACAKDSSDENPEGLRSEILINASSKRDVKNRFQDIDATWIEETNIEDYITV